MNKNDKMQMEVFKNLINILLQPHNVQIDQFEKINQGSILPKITQIILKEDIEGWKEIPDSWKGKIIFKQRIAEQESKNFSIIINHLSRKDRSFNKNKILKSTKDLLGFIWRLINKFYIVHPTKNIITLLSQILKDFEPTIQIKNMGSSFLNGLPFIALLSKASKGTIQFLDNENPMSNYNYIKESCQSLNISFVLTEECCISKPDENCNLIQVVIILKHIGEFDSLQPIQRGDGEAEIKKKFEEKIIEYKSASQIAIETINEEQDQFDKIKECFSLKDIENKQQYIYQYNITKRKIIQDNLFKAIDCWNTLKRNSERTKKSIPSDLIDINLIKQKFECLEENIKKVDLTKEENKLKDINATISNLQTIQTIKNEFNKLNEQYDMINWIQYNPDSFVYVLGEKLQTYENKLSDSLNTHQNSLKELDYYFNTIVDDIANKTIEIKKFNHNLSMLEQTLISAKYSFKAIENIDPLNEISFDPNYFQQKIDSAKKMVEDYKVVILEIEFKNKIDDINVKLQKISSQINECKEENKDIYSSSIRKKAITKLKIYFPDINLTKPIDNQELNNEYEEMRNLFKKTKEELNDLYSFLDEREKKSIEIERKSKELVEKSKCKLFWLEESINDLLLARKCIAKSEKIKDWDENAHGSTIDIYNQSIKKAHQNDQVNVVKIERLMNTEMEKIKKLLNKNQPENLKKPKFSIFDIFHYDSHLKDIVSKRKTIETLLEINEKMNFNSKSKIDEISIEIDHAEEEIKKLIIDYNNGISHFLDNESSINCSTLKEQMKEDTENANELSPYEIDQKGIKLMLKYIDFLRCDRLINYYIKKYDLLFEIPQNMNDLLNMLHDSIIIYRSTFLLNPAQFSSNIIERTQNCKDPKFSYFMAVLYVNKFIHEEENKCDIQNVIESKQEIESLPN